MTNIINQPYPLVMGIVNMSPDSFYEGSRCIGGDEFEIRTQQLIEEGASIIDIGACSTRPGSRYIPQEEEWELLKPALKKVLRVFPQITISVDTFRSQIVERAFDFVGDLIINDISAGEEDPFMLETAARLQLPYIAMHKRGTPETMQQNCSYDNVVAEVRDYLADFVKRATEAGIREIIVDPGFGFAKNIDQNYEMLHNLEQFKIDIPSGKQTPLMVGISRKSMIYKTLGIDSKDALPATSAIHMAALLGGADILRVHDVKEAVQVVKLYQKLSQNQ